MRLGGVVQLLAPIIEAADEADDFSRFVFDEHRPDFDRLAMEVIFPVFLSLV